MTPKTTLPTMTPNPFWEMLLANQLVHKSAWLRDYKSLNKIIVLYEFIKQKFRSVRWLRLLTVLLVGLFFSCAVLEVDLGEKGDDFGDEYDTYLHSTPIQSPSPTVVDYWQILLANPIIAPYQQPLVWPVKLFLILALPFFAFFLHRRLKRRRLQVLHTVWRL